MNNTERLIIFAFIFCSSKLVPIFTNQEVENIVSLLFDIPLTTIKDTLLKYYKEKTK